MSDVRVRTLRCFQAIIHIFLTEHVGIAFCLWAVSRNCRFVLLEEHGFGVTIQKDIDAAADAIKRGEFDIESSRTHHRTRREKLADLVRKRLSSLSRRLYLRGARRG